VTPEPQDSLDAREGQKARKSMRVGGLERDKPLSLEAKPWRVNRAAVRVCVREAHEGSRGEGRGKPVRGRTLEGRKPKRATRRRPP
jgi:hypothetical protein